MAVDWKGIDLQGPDGIIVAVDIARTVEDTAFLARDIAKLDEAVCEQPVLDDRAASLGDRPEAVALVGTVAVAIGVRRGRGQPIGCPCTMELHRQGIGARFPQRNDEAWHRRWEGKRVCGRG